MGEVETRLIVEHDLALVQGELNPDLRTALAAVPGVDLDAPGAIWGRRLGPDRAASVKLVADAYRLEVSPRTEASLGALVAQRSQDSPVIEAVSREGSWWLSLLDDWQALWVEELRGIPGGRSIADAGRFEVPLGGWSAPAVERAVEAHGLKLSPVASRALSNAKSGSPVSAGRPGESGPGAFDIAMHADGSHVVIHAAAGSALMRRAAELPTAHNLGEDHWLVPATREVARGLREIVAELETLELDPASTLWLDQAPRWIAHASIETTGQQPEIVVSTRWGDPPDDLSNLSDLTLRSGGHHAPLSVENTRALADLLAAERELSATTVVDATLAWLEARPEATSIPGAELDLVESAAGPTFSSRRSGTSASPAPSINTRLPSRATASSIRRPPSGRPTSSLASSGCSRSP